MMPEKVKDRAAIILSGMLPSAGDKAEKVKASVDYAVMLEREVDKRIQGIEDVEEAARQSTRSMR